MGIPNDFVETDRSTSWETGGLSLAVAHERPCLAEYSDYSDCCSPAGNMIPGPDDCGPADLGDPGLADPG